MVQCGGLYHHAIVIRGGANFCAAVGINLQSSPCVNQSSYRTVVLGHLAVTDAIIIFERKKKEQGISVMSESFGCFHDLQFEMRT